MSFYICKKCGNTENNHNFRHTFDGTIQVMMENGKFVLDAHDFPLETETFCSVENCTKPRELHGVDLPFMFRIPDEQKENADARIIKHDYQPREVSYRAVTFTLPPDTRCQWVMSSDMREEAEKLGANCECNVNLEDHDQITTHHFTTNVEVRNRSGNDKIHILDPEDEDTKIVWE